MRIRVGWLVLVASMVPVSSLSQRSADAADAPSPKVALSIPPVQSGVEIETPDAADFGKCEVKVERAGATSGWVVLGPEKQPLRRFVDTNRDNIVDQWRYYNHGIEVYRDIDGDFNNKADQSRWLNTGGSKWGLDTNEDGRIDAWKVISAEEASQEAVRALASRDERALAALLISAEDVKTLGIEKSLADKLLDSVASPASKMQKLLANSKIITSQTRWLRFDSSTPGMIPADDGKAQADLPVYANAMAIIETDKKTGLIQLGEMVRVGDAWKLTQLPQPLDTDSVQVTLGGILMQPTVAAGAPGGVEGISPEMQKLLTELQKLDENSPSPTAEVAALVRYNSQRADLLTKLAEASSTDEDRAQWQRQLADGVAAMVQTGSYPEGLKRLDELEADLRQKSPNSELVPYVTYRRLLARYTVDLQKATDEERHKVQEWWLGELEKFATSWPKSEDAPDALLQLAVAHEFAGKTDDSRKWYGELVANHPDSNAGIRAAGAVKRLDLKGQPLELSGAGLAGGTVSADSFRGKVVLVLFWATWCKPCTEDLPQLRALYQTYHDRGFEVLGVNLDAMPEPIRPYLTQHRVSWPQIYEPGGLESPPATAFGIVSLPTMFLVDAKGVVVSRSTSVDDLKSALAEMLAKK